MGRRTEIKPMGGSRWLVVPLLLLPLAVPLWIGYAAWAEQRAEMCAWDISGPPCPASKWPLSTASTGKLQRFGYAGAQFARRSGAVSCADLPAGPWWRRTQAHVCQFSAPVVLAYRYRGVEAVVAPGTGRPATVRIADGGIACVVGGWFRG